MAKKGMHRVDDIHGEHKSKAELVPELQGKTEQRKSQSDYCRHTASVTKGVSQQAAQRKTYFKFLFLYRQRLSKR